MMTRAEVQGFLSIRRFWEAERERNSLQTKRRKWLFTSATAEWISGQTVWSRTSGQRTETSRSAGLVVMEAPPEAMPLRVGSTSLHAHLKTIMYRYLTEKTDGWKGGVQRSKYIYKGEGPQTQFVSWIPCWPVIGPREDYNSSATTPYHPVMEPPGIVMSWKNCRWCHYLVFIKKEK